MDSLARQGQRRRKINIQQHWRSPTLQSVLMVEKFIEENSGEFKKTGLFKNLPKKMMWTTFQVIMNYLEETFRIIIDREGLVAYIWNPKLVERFTKRDDLKWRK